MKCVSGMNVRKRKKDFKLREDIVVEFERYAPSGKQTAIVEQLIGQWVARRKSEAQEAQMRKAYERERNKRRD